MTDRTPKCLVPIRGVPLLGIWLARCRLHGITDVLVNTHHLADQVVDFLERNSFGVKVVIAHEEILLGSAGTVLANRDFVADERAFFVLYADNLTAVDLTEMVRFHEARQGVLTMGLFVTERPEECGIVERDEDARITSFVEKPARPRSTLASAGVYFASQALFDHIPRKVPSDFGLDVFPGLVGRMYGYEITHYMLDIGTAQNYERANREWSEP